ncbi:MAG: 2-oxoacid:acceptor oxidoreductase family protein, partial [Candidatus Thorarchaeota archaeon]
SLLLGMEPLEALRAAIEYAGQKTVAVISTAIVETPGSLSDVVEYPPIEKIVNALRSICKEVVALDPIDSLEKSGSLRLLNSYMLGAMSVLKEVPLSKDEIRNAIARTLRDPELNLAAFDVGAEDALKLSR